MSDSDEESVMSMRRPYGHGGDIFRKHDLDESIEEEEEDETEEMDEDENEMKTRKKKTMMMRRRNMMMMMMMRVMRMIRKFDHGML